MQLEYSTAAEEMIKAKEFCPIACERARNMLLVVSGTWQ